MTVHFKKWFTELLNIIVSVSLIVQEVLQIEFFTESADIETARYCKTTN